MRCPTCHVEVPRESRFCLACGAAISLGAVVTLTGHVAAKPKSDSANASEEGRFPAGSILGERFRILGLLGRGGMGEVYRAFDLKLEQQVALKFLPPTATRDFRLLERFRGEVRIARQISHRNVCRVYDLGEIEGTPYISMEYVDGEDLGSLLRRIGRLPGDKALEFARRLCAGLASAHEKGVLHRDLKPANVMVDGRGQVVIMDFGLAAVPDAIADGDIRSGTPAYMAPEQREGREVTVRSDIYSMGLVFAEMFTGNKPQDGKLSSVPKDLDPAIAKVIQRCLDPNPSNRPASALDVSRALPGGDPLAEALAAGETPSPEMVAASEDTGALSVRAAVVWFAIFVLGTIAAILLSDESNPLRRTPFPDPPQILARKAHDIAQRAGYADPADSASGFDIRTGLVDWAVTNLNRSEYEPFVTNSRTSPIIFWYRQSPRDLDAWNAAGEVTEADPPRVLSEMVSINLDSEGRLFRFEAVPRQSITAAAAPVDWKPLFEAAGLDSLQWSPAEPEWLPLVSFDEQAAWTGRLAHSPNVPMRIDAAAWRGRPVQFQIRGPWQLPARDEPGPPNQPRLSVLVQIGLGSILGLSALLLALRHYRRGRGDPQGAFRLAAFIFICGIVRWLLATRLGRTSNQPAAGIAIALLSALAFWIVYIALEPYVRRHWPQSLISWTRLLNGGWKDPVVGGHLLVGAALGVVLALYFALGDIVVQLATGRFPFSGGHLLMLLGPVQALSTAASVLAGEAPAIAFRTVFVFFLFRVLFRRTWLAAAALALVTALPNIIGAPEDIRWIVTSRWFLLFILDIVILIRFGLLPLIAMLFVENMLSYSPLTTDFSVWYASSMFTSLAIIFALAVWSFRHALGGRKVWKGDILEG